MNACLIKPIRFVFLTMTFIVLSLSSSFAASPLVDVDWVKTNTGVKGIVFLDLRGANVYRAGHVPGAVNSSYGRDKWRMKRDGIKGMLPPTDHLEKLIGRLGIDNSSHVVLMHGGYSAAETGIATRIYWTLMVLGHREVSILNGGMNAYLSDKSAALEKGVVHPVAKIFTAKMNYDVLARSSDVENAIANKIQLLDSRPTDQHIGINKSGAVTRFGTLPAAISVPGRWLTVNDKGIFRPGSSLAKIYAAQKAANKGKSIVFCNTGHWASLGWFVDSQLLGNKQSKMYDGSMAQWSRLAAPSHPMSVKLKTQ